MVDSTPASPKLLNRNFVLLWQGQLVSQLGSQAFLIAMMFWTMDLTGSATLMGLLMTVSTLPGVLLSPLGGTFADRHSRLRIIIFSDVLRGMALVALVLIVQAGGGSSGVRIPVLFLVALLGGVINAFFAPAISASIPDLVPRPRLAAANSLSQLSAQAAALVGQGFGGVLYRLIGAPMLFLVDGLTYLFSAGSEVFIRLPEAHRKAEGRSSKAAMAGFVRDTVDGFRYVFHRLGMRNLLLGASVFNFLMTPIFVLLPFYVENFLRETVDWYGFLLAAISGGSVLGFVLAGALQVDGATRSRLILTLFVLTPVTIGVLGFVTEPSLALVLAVGIGAASGMINVYILTIFQASTPTELRGRVIGLLITMSGGLAPIGMALGGVAGDLTGKNVPLIYAVCGAAATMVTVGLALRRECRDFLAEA